MIGVGVDLWAPSMLSGPSLVQQAAAITLAAGGALYDPGDLTSLYQSRTGGSTGANGQPVGIMLDKSYMGGASAAAYIAARPELAVNGGFDADASWTKGAGWTIAGGVGVATASSADLSQAVLTVGKWYRVTFDATVVSGTVTPKAGSGASGTAVSATASGVTAVLRAATTTSLIFTGSTFTGTIDNISVKEIPGFHALAPSDAARPVCTVASGLTYLAADGTDDWMNVFPALNLGDAWWHVGGWRSDADSKRPFTVWSGLQGAVRSGNVNGEWQWMNSGSVQTKICTGNPAAINVLTIERASLTAIAGRYNAGGAASMTPFDNTGGTHALALFSASNSSYSGGLNGRFYGGAWASGSMSATERATLEAYAASLAGVTL